jgi:hypothetical protein
VEGFTVAQAIRRGDVGHEEEQRLMDVSIHQRARQVVTTSQWLAGDLRLAS